MLHDIEESRVVARKPLRCRVLIHALFHLEFRDSPLGVDRRFSSLLLGSENLKLGLYSKNSKQYDQRTLT